MKKEDEVLETNEDMELDAANLSNLTFTPIPIRPVNVSGLYSLNRRPTVFDQAFEEAEAELSVTPLPIRIQKEELRLDVDGRYPQMMASGFIQINLASSIHWIARLKSTGRLTWEGGIWYKNGATSIFPYTEVKIVVTKPSLFMAPQNASITFTAPGVRSRARTLAYRSPYFHSVEFEYDWEKGIEPVRKINTFDHPNHPATIANEQLTIEAVYRRAGMDVSLSASSGEIATAPGGFWSDMEMHDAMQVYWAHFANKPQWALWVLFAGLHEGASPTTGDTSLGGIMFDDIGLNERQGTALFLKSFISQAPTGDPNPAAYVNRMRFWTAVHEIGHSFNLAHSWQKSLGVPWIPLANEPNARSFMNYPYRITGGQSAFFSNFEYRFSDQELIFMRHAPAKFVQMGNAAWFDHHGFREANTAMTPTFRLELRMNRAKATYDFLEPITIELKLTNISQQPQLLTTDCISRMENLTVISKREGQQARQYMPMATYCTQHDIRTLAPGESTYDSLFVSADRNGWGLAEPGNYVLQAALHFENEDIVSAPLKLRITPSHSREEEVVAQDYFSKDVGRVYAFDGSFVLEKANDTLREIAEKFSSTRAARHALVALGNPLTRKYKMLSIQDIGAEGKYSMEIINRKIDAATAKKYMTRALSEQMELSAESLGHIDYKYYMERFTEWLFSQGDKQQAANLQNDLYKVLAARGVIQRVLNEIQKTAAGFTTTKEGQAKAT